MTNPTTHLLFSFFILFSCLTFSTFQVNGETYVQEACSVTRYQDLCVRTLASYSNKARHSPSRWARAAVSVTLGEVKVVAQYLNYLKIHNHFRKRNKSALSDCVECIQSSLDNLHKSLDVLRRLSISDFNEQMNDVITWLSAALTDQDTCVDGFEGRGGNNHQISMLYDKVQNASCITSNALAFANKLATTGLQDAGDSDP